MFTKFRISMMAVIAMTAVFLASETFAQKAKSNKWYLTVANESAQDDIWVLPIAAGTTPNVGSFAQLRAAGGKRVRKNKRLRLKLRPGVYEFGFASHSALNAGFKSNLRVGSIPGFINAGAQFQT